MALVVLEGVHVDFPIYGAQRSLRHAIFHRATGGVIERVGKRQDRIVVRALSDVSMRLEDGDRLGLIGHNGSGKSTLLKVIAGIYLPISGRMMVEGRVTPLLDMMPGLDLDDTGFENLVTAGMLLGLSREEVERKIPEIEQFSELGEYLTLPVRTYSAGMTLRLGFSLVTALEPGILLMDEGFSTGDLRFAERAAERMNDFLGRSRIIVLASHSDETIKSICNKAALMHEGQVLAFGPVDEVIQRYREMVHANGSVAAEARAGSTEPSVYNEETIRDVGLVDRLARTNGAVRFTKATARDADGVSRWKYAPGETVVFRFEYEVFAAVPSLGMLFRLYLPTNDPGGQHVITEIRTILSSGRLQPGRSGGVEVTLPRMPLAPNCLLLYVWLGPADFCQSYDVIDANVNLPPLRIENGDEGYKGVVIIEHEVKNFLVEQSVDVVPATALECRIC
jgi:ABC-type polysaccharide/polyol phosphate transport system ATPase subunit